MAAITAPSMNKNKGELTFAQDFKMNGIAIGGEHMIVNRIHYYPPGGENSR